MCPGYFLSNRTRWCFRSSIVAPLKSRTLTTWLLFDSRFSSSPVNIECSTILSVYNPAAHACLKLSGVSSFMTISVFSLFLYSEHLCFICFRPPMEPDHTKSNSFEAVSVSAVKKIFLFEKLVFEISISFTFVLWCPVIMQNMQNIGPVYTNF